MSRPGVFVTESTLPTPVTSVPPATAAGAIVAQLPSGPVSPTLVTSWYQFSRIFGGLNRTYPATYSANMFFRSGGSELYVARVVQDNAAAASASILGDGSDAGTIASETYLTFTAKSVGTYGNDLRVSVSKKANDLYDIQVFQETGDSGTDDDTLLETFTNLPLADHGNQEVVDTLAIRSQFINASWGSDATVVIPTSVPDLFLSGGTDGNSGDYTHTLALNALAEIPRVFVLFSPGETDSAVVSAMCEFAVNTSSFVVLDTDENESVASAVSYASGVDPSSHSGVYYPWLWVPDTTARFRDAVIKIPPSGAVAGAILFTDSSAGVFQAPAGISANLPFVVAMERSLTNEHLDTLNNDTRPVNAIRMLPGGGATIMGARTLDQSRSTRYVNTRRTLSYLAKDMEARVSFALFRNNDADLWEEITTVLDNFLRGFYGAGGLRGANLGEAYYIKVDSENNTATDVQLGVVNIEVGVALQYPAEFIKIKLTQRTIS